MKRERLISKIEIGTKLMTVINQDRVNRIGKEWLMDKNSLLLDYHKHHWHHQHLHREERLL